MGMEFGQVGVDVAGAEGVGKQGVLGHEAACLLDAAADGSCGKALLALAQGVAEVGEEAVAAVVHDGLVELRIQLGIGAQIASVEGGLLLIDGGDEDIGDEAALLCGQSTNMAGRVLIHEEARLVDLTDFAGANRYDQCTALGVELQESLHLQAEESLAHRGSTHSQLGGKGGLGEHLRVIDVVIDDAALEVIVGPFRGGYLVFLHVYMMHACGAFGLAQTPIRETLITRWASES